MKAFFDPSLPVLSLAHIQRTHTVHCQLRSDCWTQRALFTTLQLSPPWFSWRRRFRIPRTTLLHRCCKAASSSSSSSHCHLVWSYKDPTNPFKRKEIIPQPSSMTPSASSSLRQSMISRRKSSIYALLHHARLLLISWSLWSCSTRVFQIAFILAILLVGAFFGLNAVLPKKVCRASLPWHRSHLSSCQISFLSILTLFPTLVEEQDY